MNLRTIQDRLPPWQVNTFEHALFHAVKAMGKVAGLVDDMDHMLLGSLPSGRHPTREEAWAMVSKDRARDFLADIVISAIKAAKECPSGPIDLEQAVIDRIREKNPPGAFEVP